MSKRNVSWRHITNTFCDEFESSIRNEIPLVTNGTRNLHLCSQKAVQNNVIFQKWAKNCKAINKLVCKGS
jgi:hypothetical protein